MALVRLLRHLLMPSLRARLAFPPRTLEAIEQAIAASEATHSGQVRFAVEAALEPLPLLHGTSARDRALEVFSALRVWDTEENNGALIYVLLADRDVEVLADRGLYARTGQEPLDAIARALEAAFRERRYEAGVLAALQTLTEHLARHYPRRANGENELSDRPVVL